MNHERCRLKPIQRYAENIGRLAINTALTIKHEVSPPKPEAPTVEDDFRELNDFRPRNVGTPPPRENRERQ